MVDVDEGRTRRLWVRSALRAVYPTNLSTVATAVVSSSTRSHSMLVSNKIEAVPSVLIGSVVLCVILGAPKIQLQIDLRNDLFGIPISKIA